MKPLNHIAFGFVIASLLAAATYGDGFIATGSMNHPRYNHTATRLPDGRVLVVAGRDFEEGGLTATAELYNPVTGTWTNTGSLGSSQSARTLTLLPNGKALAVGGTTAEFYDPAAGTWSPTGNPSTDHYSDTATLLPNGKVLFVNNSIYDQSGSAELYDPVAGAWSPAGNSGAWGTATLLLNGKVLLARAGAALHESSLNPIFNALKLGDGSFQFNFSNPSGSSYHILASPNSAAPLNTWSNLGNATEIPPGSGQFQFTDLQATNHPQRFYRVTSP